jgi:hypothetical protein
MVATALPAPFIYNRPISLESIIAFSFGHNHLDLLVEALVVYHREHVTAFVGSAIRSHFAVAWRRLCA